MRRNEMLGQEVLAPSADLLTSLSYDELITLVSLRDAAVAEEDDKKKKPWWQVPGSPLISKKVTLQSRYGPIGKTWLGEQFVSVLEEYGENGRLVRQSNVLARDLEGIFRSILVRYGCRWAVRGDQPDRSGLYSPGSLKKRKSEWST
jgi:hypothetical protein